MHLQTCWCLFWDQIRGSVWNHQSKVLLWALSSLSYWDPSSPWSQLTEENSTSGIRNHWEKGPTWQQETHVSAVGCMSLLICWRLGMLQHGGLQSSDNLLLLASSSSSGGTTDSGSSGQDQSNTGFKFRNIWISHRETRAGLIGFFCVWTNIWISGCQYRIFHWMIFFFLTSFIEENSTVIYTQSCKNTIRMDESDVWFLFSW